MILGIRILYDISSNLTQIYIILDKSEIYFVKPCLISQSLEASTLWFVLG